MASRSSIRASGRWRAPVVALLLALATAACCAFSAGTAQGATIYFCPTSGWVRLGTGNGCTANDIGWPAESLVHAADLGQPLRRRQGDARPGQPTS